jgi:hypothetical protein
MADGVDIMPARVIASVRGRGSKFAVLSLYGCGSRKCHPGTIIRVREGKQLSCQKCQGSLKKILTLRTAGNERITVVSNPVEGVVILKVIRTDLSTGMRRIKTYIYHKGKIAEVRM